MRPTIRDLAKAAGVSVSTVNRVISGSGVVRKPTMDRVRDAAQEIGFYGLGSIEHAISKTRETHCLGVLLHQSSRTFYRDLAEAIRLESREFADGEIDLRLEHLETLTPDHIAERLLAMAGACEAVALVAAEHPILTAAIDQAIDRGVPVIGLIAPLSARGNVGYVGLDGVKVGRTAAWAFDRMCRHRGEIGILVGNPRFRNQELNESGFRSYFREHGSDLTLLEPRLTYESAAVAREVTETLLSDHPEMCGLFMSGGGITGTLAALRDAGPKPGFVTIGYELMEPTRAALIDGTMTMTIAHPMAPLARETLATLVRSKRGGTGAGAHSSVLDFDIFTPENI